MQSKRSVKSDEESSAKRIQETSDNDEAKEIFEGNVDPQESDCVGLKETCPFQDQAIVEGHCRTDCAWYSDDACIVWNLLAAVRRIATAADPPVKR